MSEWRKEAAEVERTTRLSPLQANVYVLTYRREASLEDAARKIGTTPESVRDARAKIREKVEMAKKTAELEDGDGEDCGRC